MAKRLTIFFLVFCAFVMPMEAGIFDSLTNYFRKPALPPPPMVKVLIVHDKSGIVLEVKGKYKIFDPHQENHISTRFIGKRKFIQAISDGIKWGEEFPGVHQIMIVPDEKNTTILVGGIEYRGIIYVYDIGGTISIVNQVSVEDFLSSTLALEYPAPLTEEFLAAVAIAARTDVYFKIENPANQYWNMNVEPSAYEGVAAVNQTSAIEQAIRATRYMIMSRSEDNPGNINPFFAQWKGMKDEKPAVGLVISQITLQEAEAMAKSGSHAAQILARAFPGMKIELMHYSDEISSVNK